MDATSYYVPVNKLNIATTQVEFTLHLVSFITSAHLSYGVFTNVNHRFFNDDISINLLVNGADSYYKRESEVPSYAIKERALWQQGIIHQAANEAFNDLPIPLTFLRRLQCLHNIWSQVANKVTPLKLLSSNLQFGTTLDADINVQDGEYNLTLEVDWAELKDFDYSPTFTYPGTTQTHPSVPFRYFHEYAKTSVTYTRYDHDSTRGKFIIAYVFMRGSLSSSELSQSPSDKTDFLSHFNIGIKRSLPDFGQSPFTILADLVPTSTEADQ